MDGGSGMGHGPPPELRWSWLLGAALLWCGWVAAGAWFCQSACRSAAVRQEAPLGAAALRRAGGEIPRAPWRGDAAVARGPAAPDDPTLNDPAVGAFLSRQLAGAAASVRPGPEPDGLMRAAWALAEAQRRVAGSGPCPASWTWPCLEQSAAATEDDERAVSLWLAGRMVALGYRRVDLVLAALERPGAPARPGAWVEVGSPGGRLVADPAARDVRFYGPEAAPRRDWLVVARFRAPEPREPILGHGRTHRVDAQGAARREAGGGGGAGPGPGDGAGKEGRAPAGGARGAGGERGAAPLGGGPGP